jgi:anti-sigma regulatory factor (Ser/Thr protein kinase)
MESSVIVALIGGAATISAATITAIATHKRADKRRLRDLEQLRSGAISFAQEIDGNDYASANRLETQILDRLVSWGYRQSTLVAVRSVFAELVQNAFEHGLKRIRNGRIAITIDAHPSNLRFRIDNPPTSTFDLTQCLDSRRQVLQRDPTTRRGRGLLSSEELADTLTSPTTHSIEAVFYRELVDIGVDDDPAFNTTLLLIRSGVQNPSFRRRLRAAAAKHPERHLIVQFGANIAEDPLTVASDCAALRYVASKQQDGEEKEERRERPGRFTPLLASTSSSESVVLDVQDERKGRSVIVVAGDAVPALLPPAMVAETIDDAMLRVLHMELPEVVGAAIIGSRFVIGLSRGIEPILTVMLDFGTRWVTFGTDADSIQTLPGTAAQDGPDDGLADLAIIDKDFAINDEVLDGTFFSKHPAKKILILGSLPDHIKLPYSFKIAARPPHLYGLLRMIAAEIPAKAAEESLLEPLE